MEASGLDQCACKRGFFTLRDCEQPATTTCGICSRRVCGAHLAPRVGAMVCVECAAKQAEEGAVRPSTAARAARQPTRDLREEDPTDPGLPYRYRARYYGYHDYQPMWWGSYDPYWSGYGYRWYDNPNDDDEDGGGFGDS